MSYAIFSKYLPTYNINNNLNFILVNKVHTIIPTNCYIKYVLYFQIQEVVRKCERIHT